MDRGIRFDLLPPAIPELWEAVQEEDKWTVAGLDVVRRHVADLGVALAKRGSGVELLPISIARVKRSGASPPWRPNAVPSASLCGAGRRSR
jgi:hypothetical protein